jgi:hypothetical protein
MKSTNATARCCLRYLSKVQPAEKNVSNRIGEEKLAEGERGSLGRYLLPRLRSRILSSPSSFKKTISIALPAMLRWACPALATPAEGRNPHFNEHPWHSPGTWDPAAPASFVMGVRHLWWSDIHSPGESRLAAHHDHHVDSLHHP